MIIIISFILKKVCLLKVYINKISFQICNKNIIIIIIDNKIILHTNKQWVSRIFFKSCHKLL